MLYKFFDFIRKDELKVLRAIEQGMHNHEWVPLKLIENFAKVWSQNTNKVLRTLLKHKLIARTLKPFEGYKLLYPGYDYLALENFKKLGAVVSIEMKIGVGKESDVYLVRNSENKLLVLKLSRLGRTSFKTVKNNRDYIKGRSHYSWLYLSRIASSREFCFMQACFKVRLQARLSRSSACSAEQARDRHVVCQRIPFVV